MDRSEMNKRLRHANCLIAGFKSFNGTRGLHYVNPVHYSDIRACPLKDENSNGPCQKDFSAGHMASRLIRFSHK